MWPEKDIPNNFLKIAQKLVTQEVVSQREFVDLCKLAVKYIKEDSISVAARNNMALYIAHLWFKHNNISSSELLAEIGGQFGEWEIPGSFRIDDEIGKRQWLSLLEMIDEADKKY